MWKKFNIETEYQDGKRGKGQVFCGQKQKTKKWDWGRISGCRELYKALELGSVRKLNFFEHNSLSF